MREPRPARLARDKGEGGYMLYTLAGKQNARFGGAVETLFQVEIHRAVRYSTHLQKPLLRASNRDQSYPTTGTPVLFTISLPETKVSVRVPLEWASFLTTYLASEG